MNQSRPCRSAPYRSALYLPASSARALDKARDLPADATQLRELSAALDAAGLL